MDAKKESPETSEVLVNFSPDKFVETLLRLKLEQDGYTGAKVKVTRLDKKIATA